MRCLVGPCAGLQVLDKTGQWERLLGTSLTTISPGISLEGIMLKLKLQYFGHLMRRVDSLEKTLVLGAPARSRPPLRTEPHHAPHRQVSPRPCRAPGGFPAILADRKSVV